VEIQQKGMDDITDHGGMVNGFQWQNENAKPPQKNVLVP
jgi:hypothetical protein